MTMMSSGVNLVMTVIGFAVSTMFIVFVCTRLVCARIQLNASRRSSSSLTATGSHHHHHHHHHHPSALERGFQHPVIASNFPTHKYSDDVFSSLEDSQCTVCLADYQPQDTLRILPYCGHSFHATCIDIWLQQHATCPICRVSLCPLPDKKRWMQPMFSSLVTTNNNNTYTTDSLATQSYHWPWTGHAYSYRHTQNSHSQRHPIQEQEDHCAVTATNAPPQVMDSNSANKLVESPSNQ